MSDGFPDGFFVRVDETDDSVFYETPRIVTHIDDDAIQAIGQLYDELGVNGRVLDLMSSWISHFDEAPSDLVALGMNAAELERNDMASSFVVQNLNVEPTLPFPDNDFDDVVCAVSVDYLTQPVEVFNEVRRILRPGGRFVCTFSNRLFPTKAIRGWLMATEKQRCQIVATYFAHATGFEPATIEHRNPTAISDPLYTVWATVA